MKYGKKLMAGLLAFSMVCSSAIPMSVNAKASETASNGVFDGSSIAQGPTDYDFTGKWIWSNDAREAGQWMCLRKTFDLVKVPEKVEAKIAVDSKYWMWINGEMVIFEGQVKTGPNREDMYVDTVDLTKYLHNGKNTIAVQAVYFGKNGYGFKDSGQPGFLFDADFGEGVLKEGTKIVSDTTWKVKKDPAYEAHDIPSNYRLAEPNIRYNVNKEMTGWQTPDFDDAEWSSAVVKAQEGDAPYNDLWERPIPQLNVEDIVKFTADGANGTGTWKVENIDSSTDEFTAMEFPDEYTVTAEFAVDPIDVTGKYGDITDTGSFGLTLNMKDANNLYMAQISMANLGDRKNFAEYRPHICNGGSWSVPQSQELKDIIENDQRFNVKHVMSVKVEPDGFTTSLDGTALNKVNVPVTAGNKIGFRNDTMEKIKLYGLKVQDKDGKVLFQDTIQSDSTGTRLSQFASINGGAKPVIKKEADGTHYLSSTNSILAIGSVKFGDAMKRYTIRNRTNLQGTPYLKVKAKEGQRIDMYTDTWKEPANNGDSVRHAYITRDGEQEFEPLGWINGYDVYFEIPESVEVLELGFRPSTYNTKPEGSFTSDDADMNKLYQKSYDTLLVTMRDNYMDCPDRERAQWWGDAVNEMQMAFYAMDSNAGHLYKKALNQVIGWQNAAGQLPTTSPNGVDAISELPMQALAGVHSFWQYYMYSGDTQPMVDGYETLLNYLKLWSVNSEGLVGHRGGTWDWMDWGNHADGTIIEQCWYYIACEYVLNMANLLDKPKADKRFLEDRMYGIAKIFDSKFWNEDRKAYYNNVDDGNADDRANALAVYTGLAKTNRYSDIAELLKTRKESSPYMEKYVLEALYMMGYDDLAMQRTKERYRTMIDDEFPTLWEFWDKNAGTRNHAWTGGPLTMMYMFNAGITPLEAAYKGIQIRPQTAGLKDIKASVPSPNGEISTAVKEEAGSIRLQVSIPEGADYAVVYVPRLDGKQTKVQLGDTVIYKDGAATEKLPEGVIYEDEDDKFVGFRAASGEYTFTATEDTAEIKEEYSITIHAPQGEGTVEINGKTEELPYSMVAAKGSKVTVKATPAKGWKIAKVTGNYPAVIPDDKAAEAYISEYTVDRDMNYTAVFEQLPKEKYAVNIDISGNHSYAANLYVNGEMVSAPYVGSFYTGEEVTVKAEIPEELKYNYEFTGWNGQEDVNPEYTVTVGEEDIKLTMNVKELSEKITPVTVIQADNAMPGSDSWKKDNLVDGNRTSVNGSDGFTTNIYETETIDGQNIVLDLGSAKTFNQLSMFPRTSAKASGDNMSAHFPKSFTISVSTDGKTYKTVKKVVDLPNPRFKQQVFNFCEQTARYIKITTTKLGDVATDEGNPNYHRIQIAEVEVSDNTGVKATEADRTAIDREIQTALQTKETDTYKKASRKTKTVFDETLAAAREIRDVLEATEEELAAAVQTLKEAIDGLAPVDKSGLQAVIEKAQAIARTDVYYESSKAARNTLDDALEAAKVAMETETDVEEPVEKAIADLEAALAGLDAMPDAPADVKVTDISSNYAVVSWTNTHAGTKAVLFKVYADGTLLAAVDGEQTAVTLMNLSAQTEYDLQVYAVDAAGTASEAAGVSFATPEQGAAPEGPAELKAEELGIAVSTAAGFLPEDTQLKAETVDAGARLEQIAAVLKFDIENFQAYNVNLVRGNSVLALNGGEAAISLPVPEGCDEEKTEVYMVTPLGEKEKMDCTITDGKAEFSTAEMGTFVIGRKVLITLESIKAVPRKTQIVWDEATTLREIIAVGINGQEQSLEGAVISYHSDNEDAATVTEDGTILAGNAGTTNITVSVEKDGVKVSDTFEITVNEIAPAMPGFEAKSSTSIALIQREGYEYAMLEDGKAPVFGSQVRFEGLKQNTVYRFCQRIAATSTHRAGQASEAAAIRTDVQAVAKVVLNQTELTLTKGGTAVLRAEVQPADAADKKLTFTSSNVSIVKVDAAGNVTAMDAGNAEIIVESANGRKAVCKVTVKDTGDATGAEVKKITLDFSRKTMGVKEKAVLGAKVSPTDAVNQKLIYKSSNSRVVSVNAKGQLSAKKAGKAVITVTAANGVKATCRITVKKAPKSIKLSGARKTLKVGKSFRLKVKYSQGSAGGVTFRSSKKSVATVSADGKVTAKKRGKVTITAKSYNGKRAKVVIRVTK